MRFFRTRMLVVVFLVSLALGCQNSRDTGAPTGTQPGQQVPVKMGGKDKAKPQVPPLPPPPP